MTTELYESKKTNGLVRIISKVAGELAYPFIAYSNYRRDLFEGKRNLKLNYLRRKGELGYEIKLNEYEQELERKLQESEMSERMFDVVNKGIKYIRENYDWEKEKRQAKAIAKRVGTVGKGVEWAGRKAKVLAQKEWEKEKDIIKERVEKLKQKKDEFIQRKKEKLFLKFNRFKKEVTQMNNQLSKLDPEKNYNYMNNLKWRGDKLYENFEKAENKLRQRGYPI